MCTRPTGWTIVSIRKRGPTGAYVSVGDYSYNTQHLPLTYTDAAGQTTQYAYNAAGQLTRRTNALGEITGYEYDTLGQLTRIVNANGNTAWTLAYDAVGRVATRTDSQGRAVGFTYDAFDRPTVITYPDATTEQRSYDKLDLASFTDRLNRSTIYTYDANRNVKTVKDPLQRTTSFGYYRNGELQSMTDAKGNLTTWQRDLQGRATAKTYADGSSETFTWETYGGRLKSRTDASGRTQTFNYRRDNLTASIAYTGGGVATPTVKFAYDPVFERVTSMTDGNGATAYQYGAIGALGALQLTSENGPFANDDIAYAYDALGRMRQRSVAGSAESFAFDALSRVSTEQNALGNVANTYLGDTFQPVSQAIGATVGSSFTYENNTGDRRLKSIANIATRGYQYTSNAQGLITSIGDNALAAARKPLEAARTWTPSYDAADRLIGSALSTGENYAYGYDAADNLTSWQTPLGNVAATYGTVNQMKTLGGVAVVQDAAGNLVDDAQRTYQWDGAGRLVTINYKGLPSLKSEFKYDGLGRRTAIVETNGATVTETRYLWCGAKLCQARDGADNVTRRYFDEGEFRPQASSRSYYARDHLGSVRDVSNVANGSVLGSLDYDPYGNLKKSTGTATASDFRYAGMFYHPTSGLYLTWYRAYDPNAARWLSRDPVGETGGANLFGYVSANPVNLNDPTGACPWCIGALIGGGLDLGLQLLMNGGNISCVNWWEVAGSAALGALGNVGGAGGAAKAAAAVEQDFFAGAKYTDKVLGQMKLGDFHAFPESVKAFQDAGQVSKLTGGDGVVREILKIPGGYGGKEGSFEFIKDAAGNINHRLFRPN